MASALLRRLLRVVGSARHAGVRIEVCPPVRATRRPAWQRTVGRWLASGGLTPAPVAAPAAAGLPRGPSRLARVRREFVEALDGIDGQRSAGLRTRLQRAHSLRDLWHLRAEVFHLVSLQCGQDVAAQRLARLNRHFPVRMPRSAFGTLDTRNPAD